MFIKNSKIVCTIKKIVNNNYLFYSLLGFNILFCLLNIYKQIFFFGVLFFVFNFLFISLTSKKKIFYLLFFLYPLARVLKFPNIGTSIFTLLLAFSYVILILRFFIEKQKITTQIVFTSTLFLSYVLLTFTVSLINRGFAWNELFSYYLYLAFPFVAFVCYSNRSDCDGTNNLLFCMTSYLCGMLITIAFYKIVPNGIKMLNNLGVNVFEMGAAGIRFSPLTDDPNYGTALILLLSCIFILAKKSKLQKVIGYPTMIIGLGLSCLSISKMLIGGIFVLLVCFIILIMKKIDNLIINSSIILIAFLGMIIFLSTSLGTSLLIRTIGTRDGLSLNRITSGRTELFGAYSSYILSNPLVVLFGKGPLFIDSVTFRLGEHNTFTKNVFGSGLIGVSLILIAFYIMAKNRFDRLDSLPKSPFTLGFVVCLFVCCMSLGLAPSTVFPIFVVSCQFADLNNQSFNLFMEVTI